MEIKWIQKSEGMKEEYNYTQEKLLDCLKYNGKSFTCVAIYYNERTCYWYTTLKKIKSEKIDDSYLPCTILSGRKL